RGFVRRAIGRGAARLLHQVCSGRHDGEVDLEMHRTAMAAFGKAYSRTCIKGTTVRENAVEALQMLAAEGRRLVVATNKPRHPAQLVLDRCGLIGLVDNLVSPEDAGVHKPDPRFVTHCLQGRSPSAALLVGDSEVDADTARGAGLPFVAIRGGYNEGRDIGEMRPPPERVIDSLRELPSAVASIEAESGGGR
ncbi:MAG: HAD-IA family hydrolase, partial [Planctomycetota bacterium]|nr:HAD-IA family hydrolase [Planctomycetota bacterium]